MTFLKSKQVCELTIDTSTIDQNYVLYIQKVRLIYKKMTNVIKSTCRLRVRPRNSV